MINLMRSETRKLLTTRSTWGITAGLIAVVTLGVLQTAGGPGEVGKELWEKQGFFLATLNGRMFLIVLGIKAATDDFRYGTIVPTLLASPRRHLVVIAKMAVAGSAGLVATLLAATAIVAAYGSVPTVGELRNLAGFALAGGLWSAIGAGVGFVVRHQVAGIVGAIVWVMAGEQMVAGRWAVGDWLPGNLGATLAIGEASATVVTAGAILVAYAVAAGLAGAITTMRRDVI